MKHCIFLISSRWLGRSLHTGMATQLSKLRFPFRNHTGSDLRVWESEMDLLYIIWSPLDQQLSLWEVDWELIWFYLLPLYPPDVIYVCLYDEHVLEWLWSHSQINRVSMYRRLQLFASPKSFLEKFPFSSSNARFFISPHNTYLFALKISGFASHRLPEDSSTK
jgi:hypothetical protein